MPSAVHELKIRYNGKVFQAPPFAPSTVMLTGITLFCFTASYAVALGLEISRLFFRSGVRGAVMLGFAAAGLFAHTWYLANQASQNPPGSVPLSSWYHWYLVAAWILAATYLYLTYYHPQNPIGLFVLPLVLLMVGIAWYFRHDPAVDTGEATRFWLIVHSASLLVGTVVVLIGFVAGLMYLIEAWRLKRKLPPLRGFRLPSLEWGERAGGRTLVISTILVGLGVAAGLIRNVGIHAEGDRALPWSDPVVWSSGLLIGWLVVAVIFNALYRPARQGRKVAYLTVASFVFLVLALAVVLFGPSAHPSQRTSKADCGLWIAGCVWVEQSRNLPGGRS